MAKERKKKIKKGLFFVIEGNDGSGKTEQSKRLLSRFKKEGFETAYFDFPQYEKESSYFIREYLNGKYGKIYEVDAYKASAFYALDRFEASFRIRELLKNRTIIVSNRYLGANFIHQGAKIRRKEERLKFYQWVKDFEFTTLGIPKPDLNILLYVPAKIAFRLASLSRKRKRIYAGRGKDIHEGNLPYLRKVERIILEIASLFPKEFDLIKYTEKGKLLSLEAIHQKIWEKIEKFL